MVSGGFRRRGGGSGGGGGGSSVTTGTWVEEVTRFFGPSQKIVICEGKPSTYLGSHNPLMEEFGSCVRRSLPGPSSDCLRLRCRHASRCPLTPQSSPGSILTKVGQPRPAGRPIFEVGLLVMDARSDDGWADLGQGIFTNLGKDPCSIRIFLFLWIPLAERRLTYLKCVSFTYRYVLAMYFGAYSFRFNVVSIDLF